MGEKTLGIIGGSGIYDLPGLEDRKEVAVETPFGLPSDRLVTGTMFGVRMAFLPRHGKGHRLAPHELPFRANLHAMKQLGMAAVVGISAVGSMREDIRPGQLVLVDQFLDRTRGRTQQSTFFGDGCVAHAHFADPVWEPLRQLALAAARRAGAVAHDGGTYLCMEGPLFSTRAESRLYRSWGVDVIGMTNLQEAKLAREAEIAYATVALVTDYDCWHEVEGDVDVAAVLAVLRQNADLARQVVVELARGIADGEPVSAAGCMEHALITHKDAISADSRRRLALLIGRYLG
ncbi:MAG: S-methyl-5'-thioadenosine phosphorylase [Planctomycetes bacterium]|nr:S-methyl-5'-thioadenosine phosphorylase [Planctomycetota bacterium]MCC7397226.1 S-methyl-5'-thioadenosine phosphorylase [Planctomycetota bacterium]